MLSRYRPFLHLLLLLFSLLPSHDSLAVNRKRVTFLPYGDSFKPTDRARGRRGASRGHRLPLRGGEAGARSGRDRGP